MYNYNYTALNEKGRKMRGEIIADNEYDLEARLSTLGLDLIDFKEKKEKKAGTFSKVKMRDLILFCLQMEQLSRAGVPLHEALQDARDATESPKFKNILTSVYEAVRSGIVLSEALGQHPGVFDEVFTGLVSAGEKTGDLSESFVNLANHMKWTDELRRKVKKALRYPITLLVVLSGVISVLMVFVVPKLVDFILGQGFEIPLHTELLIAFSSFFGEFWYLILGTPVILIFLIKTLNRTSEAFAYRFDAMALKSPLIGNVIRKIDLARFTHFFSVMFRSGIDILDSLEAGKQVTGNRIIQESITMVHRSVTEGNRLTESIRLSSQFPNLVVRMFKVGEDSGNMNDALENVNFFYNREVDDAVDGMVGMIQPILTTVMGLMIFWIIAAVFGPLYESFSQMNI